jgi:hypothetical protein
LTCEGAANEEVAQLGKGVPFAPAFGYLGVNAQVSHVQAYEVDEVGEGFGKVGGFEVIVAEVEALERVRDAGNVAKEVWHRSRELVLLD